MKIFVTGANGQLAKYLSELYSDAELYLGTKSKLDVTNKDQVLKQISKFKPDIVFHLASITRGDESAKNPKQAFEVNVQGTKNVVEACRKNESALLLVSTNEVFDGLKKVAYIEKDPETPVTVIGKDKYEAERIIRENLKRYFIIRTSWLYGEQSSNFLHVVLKKARDEKEIRLVEDEISSPTYSLDLAIAIKKLVATKKYGIYHLSNLGSVSRLEFAKKAFEICKINNIKIIPIKLSDYPRISKPPLYTPLKNTKAKKLGIEMPKWDDALKRFLASAKI
jgi:dTDP-4-dehydrorhamnose reductase